MVSAVGGNSPQALMHDACRAIGRGDLDVVLVTGAEAMYARALARRDPAKPWLEWASQPAETPAPEIYGVDKPGASELEMNRGVILPVHAYPLLENALRAANGWTLEEHRGRIGALWSRFSEVAAGNPDAWIRKARTPEEIVTPSADNRMVSFPYPKLCTANMQVDQGAGYIVCSVEAARSAGVPEERWVFPLSGVDANDHWFISQRAELHRSPAIRLAGAAALGLAGLGIDDVAVVDLYSCFPVVVQMAAFELGLGARRPVPAADVDRRAHLRWRAREQLHVARDRPGRRRVAGGAGDGCVGHRARLVRDEALAGRVRARGRRKWVTDPLRGATSSPRSMRCHSAPSTSRRSGRCGWRPTRWRSTGKARRSVGSSRAAQRRTPEPGATSATPTRWRSSASRRGSAAPGCWPKTGCSSSTTDTASILFARVHRS